MEERTSKDTGKHRSEKRREGAAAPAPVPTLTTKEEWREFAKPGKLHPPVMLDDVEEREALSKAERKAYNRGRTLYHNNFGILEVPALREIHHALLPRIRGNVVRPPGARRGAIIDGTGGVGKTTICTHLGRKHERYMRGLYPEPRTLAGDEFIPVVYITLPASTTIKGLNLALARFYGIVGAKKAATKDELGYLVLEHAKRCATSLVIVDDIHFLNLYKQRDHNAVNDHLKYLANTISATFLFAGIGCERSGLLTEGNGPHEEAFSQTRRRFSLHRVSSFSLSTRERRNEWRSLLKSLEKKLVLEQAEDGMLHKELPSYLYERTGGYIGSLAELVRGGANLAIATGEERITKELLDDVILDYAAEEGRRTA